MLSSSLLLAAALQVGPFYEQRTDFRALRPIWANDGESTDILWPVWTSHRDWWRFCFFVHDQETADGGYQFEIMPLWFNGRTNSSEDSSYAGLFPIYGYHPHIVLLHDFQFAFWPLWMRYRMPRQSENRWLTSNAVLFPFIHWRSDGAWGFWPFYCVNYARESVHRTALWPLVTWADYREDRDTSGKGTSWMVWPLVGHVERERESQWLFIPPFFSHAETPDGWRSRFLYPIVEVERYRDRSRTCVFPFYEHIVNRRFYDGAEDDSITRFGWRIVELLPDETRVFPFWASGRGHRRLWPFWEEETVSEDVSHGRFLSLFPIRWVPAVDRNWSKFWTFYETESNPVFTFHSLFWGIIRWRTSHD